MSINIFFLEKDIVVFDINFSIDTFQITINTKLLQSIILFNIF